jgi:hypothetical protein
MRMLYALLLYAVQAQWSSSVHRPQSPTFDIILYSTLSTHMGTISFSRSSRTGFGVLAWLEHHANPLGRVFRCSKPPIDGVPAAARWRELAARKRYDQQFVLCHAAHYMASGRGER